MFNVLVLHNKEVVNDIIYLYVRLKKIISGNQSKFGRIILLMI